MYQNRRREGSSQQVFREKSRTNELSDMFEILEKLSMGIIKPDKKIKNPENSASENNNNKMKYCTTKIKITVSYLVLG